MLEQPRAPPMLLHFHEQCSHYAATTHDLAEDPDAFPDYGPDIAAAQRADSTRSMST